MTQTEPKNHNAPVTREPIPRPPRERQSDGERETVTLKSLLNAIHAQMEVQRAPTPAPLPIPPRVPHCGIAFGYPVVLLPHQRQPDHNTLACLRITLKTSGRLRADLRAALRRIAELDTASHQLVNDVTAAQFQNRELTTRLEQATARIAELEDELKRQATRHQSQREQVLTACGKPGSIGDVTNIKAPLIRAGHQDRDAAIASVLKGQASRDH